MSGRDGKDGQGFGDVLLEPAGKGWSGFVMASDGVLESPLCFGGIVGVEDSPVNAG